MAKNEILAVRLFPDSAGLTHQATFSHFIPKLDCRKASMYSPSLLQTPYLGSSSNLTVLYHSYSVLKNMNQLFPLFSGIAFALTICIINLGNNLVIDMVNNNLSDLDIEILLLGKWRFNTSWEKITVSFRNDMTYEQTRIQTFIMSKPKELITGNKFSGVWFVSEKKLHFHVKSAPYSAFNFTVPVFKFHLADIIVSLASIFDTEKYEVDQIDRSHFTLYQVINTNWHENTKDRAKVPIKGTKIQK